MKDISDYYIGQKDLSYRKASHSEWYIGHLGRAKLRTFYGTLILGIL